MAGLLEHRSFVWGCLGFCRPGSDEVEWQVHGYEARPAPSACNATPLRAQKAGNVVGQASGRAGEDEMPLQPAVQIQWPKFKTRRLIGGWTGCACPVGLSEDALSVQKKLGEGAYGKVYRASLGGTDLAIKTFEANKWAFALEEASIAEWVGDHPHICQLLDAYRREDQVSCLVYAFGGRSVDVVLKGSSPLPPNHIRLCMSHVFKGVAHLHSLRLLHGDLKPANVLMREGEHPHFVVADLGGLVEVGRGVVRIPNVAVTFWYTSPEILDDQSSALGDTWLRADVWALGITMAEICGLDFFKVNWKAADRKEKLRAALWNTVGASPGASWPGFVPDLIGHGGMELLDDCLAWEPGNRPSCASCSVHPFLSLGQLVGRDGDGFVPCFEGIRHPWTIISGYMHTDVLDWLRKDASQLQEWKQKPSLQSGAKSILAGRMDENAASESLNGLSIRLLLPAPRLRAWLLAFRTLNAEPLKHMLAQAEAALKHFSEEELGLNGKHYLATPWESWFLTAGELHIFDNPGQLREERHKDGGASILHLNITLYGRRVLECFTNQSASEPASRKWDLVPGSVYLGILTGPEHQVLSLVGTKHALR